MITPRRYEAAILEALNNNSLDCTQIKLLLSRFIVNEWQIAYRRLLHSSDMVGVAGGQANMQMLGRLCSNLHIPMIPITTGDTNHERREQPATGA